MVKDCSYGISISSLPCTYFYFVEATVYRGVKIFEPFS